MPFKLNIKTTEDKRSERAVEARRQSQNAVMEAVEDAAKGRGYEDAVTLASYANSTNPEWRAEAEAFIAWRDQVWQTVFDQLGAVAQGQREMPTPAQAVDALPDINWPSARGGNDR